MKQNQNHNVLTTYFNPTQFSGYEYREAAKLLPNEFFSRAQREVIGTILNYAASSDAMICFAANQTIAKLACSTISTVSRTYRRLEQYGLVLIANRRRTDKGQDTSIRRFVQPFTNLLRNIIVMMKTDLDAAIKLAREGMRQLSAELIMKRESVDNAGDDLPSVDTACQGGDCQNDEHKELHPFLKQKNKKDCLATPFDWSIIKQAIHNLPKLMKSLLAKRKAEKFAAAKSEELGKREAWELSQRITSITGKRKGTHGGKRRVVLATGYKG